MSIEKGPLPKPATANNDRVKTPSAMGQRKQDKLSRRERRTKERMAAKEAQRRSKTISERELQQGKSLAGFIEPTIQQLQRNALPLLAFLVAIFVFYFPALSGEFIWDDVIFFAEETIHDWSGLWDIWFTPSEIAKEGHYWPVTYTTFWLDHKLFGLNPIGYHIVNCLLYFINVVLIWRLLLKLEVPGAWAISMIFTVHPLHVESVAWLIERKDLLSALFYLSAVHAWLRFRESSSPKTYVLALGLYALGLLSKSIVVTLPVALLVLLWWKQERVSAQDIMRLLPFFVVGFVIALGDYLFYVVREAILLDLDYSFLERVLIAAQAVWFYAGKLMWPTNLIVVYPHWDVSTDNLIGWLFVGAVAGVLILLWSCRHRIGKGPLAGVAFFVITLSPILGFVDYRYMLYSFVADRYQYLAGLGLIAVLVGGAVHVIRPYFTSFRPAIMGAFAILMIGLGILTWRQATIYQDQITFYRHIVAHNPAAYDAYHNLGIALFEAERPEEGYEASLKSLEHQPNKSKTHSNIAASLFLMERYDEAEKSIKRALELDPENKAAWQNYGLLYLKRQHYEEAVAAFQKAIYLDADSILAHKGIADSYYELGHHTKAMKSIDRALALAPSPSVQDKLSQLSVKVLLALGKTEEAQQRLLAASPNDDSDYEIWRLLELQKISAKQGDTGKAGAYLPRILKLAEGNPKALQSTADIFRQQKQYAKAIEIYEEILAIDPDFAVAYAGMGDALFQSERYEEAIEPLERSIELDSSSPATIAGYLLLLGEAASKLGRSADAAQYYERALELAPQDASVLEHLAMVRFGEERYEDALRLITSARDIRPEDARIHFNIGTALYHLGRPEEAIRSLETALSLDPSMEHIHAILEQLKMELEGQE